MRGRRHGAHKLPHGLAGPQLQTHTLRVHQGQGQAVQDGGEVHSHVLQEGERQKEHQPGDFRAAMAWLMGQAESSVGRQRYKGLGEMNPEQLWETTMNPEKRVLKRVELQDALEASELFEKLMGQEVAPRREFIEEHARYAELDI